MEASLCGFYKSAYITCNLFVVSVILFIFTILVCLLLIQASQNFSTPSIFNFIVLFMGEGLLACELDSSSESEDWGLSIDSVVIFPGLISSTSLETWTTLLLLAWSSQWYQSWIYGLKLSKYVGRRLSCTSIIFSEGEMSSIKWFLFLVADPIIFSPYFNTICSR